MTEPPQELIESIAPSTDLSLPAEAVNPHTGELVPLNDIVKVARAIQDIREWRLKIGEAIDLFSAAAVEESRRQGTRTLQAGGLTVTVSADTDIEWDVEGLLAGLRELGLPEARLDALVTATVTYRVNGSVARQIAAATPGAAGVIEAAKGRVPRRQYVSVK